MDGTKKILQLEHYEILCSHLLFITLHKCEYVVEFWNSLLQLVYNISEFVSSADYGKRTLLDGAKLFSEPNQKSPTKLSKI